MSTLNRVWRVALQLRVQTADTGDKLACLRARVGEREKLKPEHIKYDSKNWWRGFGRGTKALENNISTVISVISRRIKFFNGVGFWVECRWAGLLSYQNIIEYFLSTIEADWMICYGIPPLCPLRPLALTRAAWALAPIEWKYYIILADEFWPPDDAIYIIHTKTFFVPST